MNRIKWADRQGAMDKARDWLAQHSPGEVVVILDTFDIAYSGWRATVTERLSPVTVSRSSSSSTAPTPACRCSNLEYNERDRADQPAGRALCR